MSPWYRWHGAVPACNVTSATTASAAPIFRLRRSCPMRGLAEGYQSHSRTTPQASRPAFTHVSLLAKET